MNDETRFVLGMVIATLGEAEEHDEHWERQGRAVLAAARRLSDESGFLVREPTHLERALADARRMFPPAVG